MAKKLKRFKTRNGKDTDIFHSMEYAKMKYPERKAKAFDKSYLGKLTERDKNLMRGYAQAKIEEIQAFKYRHPKYVRKSL